MSTRELVKWQPFSAVIPSNIMINDVLKEKNKIKMPVLSEDQNNELQNKMITSYNNEEIIIIKYFRAGRLYKLKGKITNIDQIAHKIVVNNQISIFFSQIIEFF